VWRNDVSGSGCNLHASAKEAAPGELPERVIAASSSEGDIVLDPFVHAEQPFMPRKG
jgi:DNA modification methylase